MIRSTVAEQYWKMNQQSEVLALPTLDFSELVQSCDFVAERRENDSLQGFMLGISAGKGADNFGYQWFLARFDDFLFVDRVVVDQDFHRTGVATSLYDDALHWCRQHGIARIVCQIHDRPPNPAARALHLALGFQEIESVMLPSRNIVTMFQRSTAIATP